MYTDMMQWGSSFGVSVSEEGGVSREKDLWRVRKLIIIKLVDLNKVWPVLIVQLVLQNHIIQIYEY